MSRVESLGKSFDAELDIADRNNVIEALAAMKGKSFGYIVAEGGKAPRYIQQVRARLDAFVAFAEIDALAGLDAERVTAFTISLMDGVRRMEKRSGNQIARGRECPLNRSVGIAPIVVPGL